MVNYLHLKITVFWDVAPCSLVETDRLIALMMEAVSTSETSINFYQITRLNNQEDSHLQEPLKFHLLFAVIANAEL
jgi:hypothetical protein